MPVLILQLFVTSLYSWGDNCRLYKSLNLNRVSKYRKLYAFWAVLILLAVVVAVLAWIGGNPRTATLFSALAVGCIVIFLIIVRNISRQRESDETHYAAKRSHRRRCMMAFLESRFCFY